MAHLTFEDFLKEEHASNYHGTDDKMSDAFDDWLGALDLDDIVQFAEAYGRKLAGL